MVVSELYNVMQPPARRFIASGRFLSALLRSLPPVHGTSVRLRLEPAYRAYTGLAHDPSIQCLRMSRRIDDSVFTYEPSNRRFSVYVWARQEHSNRRFVDSSGSTISTGGTPPAYTRLAGTPSKKFFFGAIARLSVRKITRQRGYPYIRLPVSASVCE